VQRRHVDSLRLRRGGAVTVSGAGGDRAVRRVAYGSGATAVCELDVHVGLQRGDDCPAGVRDFVSVPVFG